MSIPRIYIGLPDHLIEKVLWVDPSYRPNPMSHTPGGSDVIIEWCDGRTLGYDKVKYPSRYIEEVLRGVFLSHEKIRLETVKSEICHVFARKYKDSKEYSTSSFQEVWNAENATQFPWEALKPFDRKEKQRFASSREELEAYSYFEEEEETKDDSDDNEWDCFWSGLDESGRANILNYD